MRFAIGILASIIASILLIAPAQAGKREKAETVVAEATAVVRDFTTDGDYRALWSHARNAEAIVVIPSSVRGGFLVGASGGNGVMLARGENDAWSQPSFMRVSSLSFGFQAGGDVSAIVLVVMTKRGMEQLLSSSVKLGGDLSISAGPVGGGAKAQTTDVVAFAKSKGLYGSVSVEGAVIKIHNKWNKAYYGSAVSPLDIIYRGAASNPQSANLRRAVAALSSKRPDAY